MSREAMALRFGQAMAALEGAIDMIEIAQRSWDLMSEQESKQMVDARSLLVSIQQTAWSRTDHGQFHITAVSPKKRRKR